MTKRLVFFVLCLCCIGWLGLIFHLSTENGEKTADTSMKIAEKISGMLYSSPTQEQVQSVHHAVRKLAHVVMFFVFGVLISVTGIYISSLWRKPWAAVAALVIGFILIVGVGWLDEWHKQFIEGRHYQLGEAIINIISGLSGSGIMVILWKFFTGL